MKSNLASFLIALGILFLSFGAMWLILKLASPQVTLKVGGNEATYSDLQQSILKQ